MVEKYRVQISGDLGSNFKFVFVEGDNKYSTVNSVTKKKDNNKYSKLQRSKRN